MTDEEIKRTRDVLRVARQFAALVGEHDYNKLMPNIQYVLEDLSEVYLDDRLGFSDALYEAYLGSVSQ